MPTDTRVFFRGPALFMKSKDGHARQVLLPHCERMISSDSGNACKHPDDSNAQEHFSGLLVVAPDLVTVVFRADLRSRVVTLLDGTDVDCKLGDKFEEVTDIEHLANGHMDEDMTLNPFEANDFWRRTAAQVFLRGGVLDPDMYTDVPFFFDSADDDLSKEHPIALTAVWSPSSEAGTRILIADPDGSHTVSIQLMDGQTAYIFNWDKRAPMAGELNKFPEGGTSSSTVNRTTAVHEDTDFKWMYQLFNPPTPTYTSWIGAGKKLRAPCTYYAIARPGDPTAPFPGTSACASACATMPE